MEDEFDADDLQLSEERPVNLGQELMQTPVFKTAKTSKDSSDARKK